MTNPMDQAIKLANDAIEQGTGGPFGAVILLNEQIIGKGQNRVVSDNDPTAHAEIVAIRDASARLNHYSLQGAILYTSCEPCPMCLGAVYWARIEKVFYAANRADAAKIGFDDHLFYQEFDKHLNDRKLFMEEMQRPQALKIFDRWMQMAEKKIY